MNYLFHNFDETLNYLLHNFDYYMSEKGKRNVTCKQKLYAKVFPMRTAPLTRIYIVIRQSSGYIHHRTLHHVHTQL